MRAGAGRDIVAPSAYPRGMAYDALDAALIDLDGTLVDTLGDFELVLHMAMGELGLPTVDRAFIARTVGKGSTHLLQRCLAHVGADPGLLDALWALYQRQYLEVNGRQSHVYPGIPEGLVKMREAGLKLVRALPAVRWRWPAMATTTARASTAWAPTPCSTGSTSWPGPRAERAGGRRPGAPGDVSSSSPPGPAGRP